LDVLAPPKRKRSVKKDDDLLARYLGNL